MRSQRLDTSMNIFITLNEIQGNGALLTAGLWISQHIIKRYLLESLQLTLKKCACNLFTCHVFNLFTAILKCSVQIKHTRMKYICSIRWCVKLYALNSDALREGISKHFTTPSYMALGFTVCTEISLLMQSEKSYILKKNQVFISALVFFLAVVSQMK